MERAASLSPNALLRPVVQDSMLPTVAYIGGPAEIAYLAQSEALYRAILGRMPVAVPRTGFTILDQRSEKLMERYGLALARSLPRRGSAAGAHRRRAWCRPPARAMRRNRGGGGERARAPARRLAGVRPHPGGRRSNAARARSATSSRKIERKAGREACAATNARARDAASLYGLIYPERHLQERLYSILPFLAKHGFDLIGHIYEPIELDCPDHRLMVV